MQIPFSKMQATGNDFVVIDARTQSLDLTRQQIQQIADRRRGVGCDQIMVLTPPSTGAQFDYSVFNADGGRAGQCGNGARAVALFAADPGQAAQTIHMGSPAGPVTATVSGRDVRVSMGQARFDAADIPLATTQTADRYHVDVDGQTVRFAAVSIGNPHAVIDVDDVDDADVEGLGRALQRHAFFPEGVNVGFRQRLDRAHMRLRVCERGVGETPACGTGACAAVVTGIAAGQLAAQVAVDLPGGRLVIDCTGRDDTVWLSGPAHAVFEGHITV